MRLAWFLDVRRPVDMHDFPALWTLSKDHGLGAAQQAATLALAGFAEKFQSSYWTARSMPDAKPNWAEQKTVDLWRDGYSRQKK